MNVLEPRIVAGSIRFIFTLLTLFILPGCGSMTTRGYESFVEEIDQDNQLEISLSPAFYPRKKDGSSEWNEKMETYGKLNFHVFIMDKDGYGKNPHVESVIIHSFSYQLADGNKTEILSDYNYNFWMQGNSRYNKNRPEVPPIPYISDSKLKFWIEFTLNGKKYSKEGILKSNERSYRYSTHIRDMMM